jgi:cytochrome c6
VGKHQSPATRDPAPALKPAKQAKRGEAAAHKRGGRGKRGYAKKNLIITTTIIINKMKTLNAIFATIITITLCFQSCGEPPQTVDVSKSISGPDIFKKYCQTCHGADGKLGLNGAKDLTVTALSVEQRTELISNGKGVMTPFKSTLTPEQIRAVAEYTTTFK